jgi:hypothetical protein
MKHRRASGLLLAVIIGAGASLSDTPSALSQVVVPTCEKTATGTALTGTALDTATPVANRQNVTFNGSALVLNGATSGKVVSNALDLATVGLSSTLMVIMAARLSTTITGNVRFFMSVSDPPEWVEAYRCNNVPTSMDFCVRFPDAAGRTLRWKALMDTSTGTPSITRVQPTFDYLPDNEHYRGGITADEGVIYFGGFSQPGDLGQLYAMSANFNQRHFTARERLQTTGRKIFTSSLDGRQELVFDYGNEATLMPLLGASTVTEATDIIRWARDDQRFGTNPVDGVKRRFGGVISSTPTVVGQPDFPIWFFRVSDDERNVFRTFQATNAQRPTLLLYGAKDGMVHALHTDPDNLTDSEMGKEAWAFIPGSIAARMKADRQATIAAGNKPVIGAYPDTWPVVEDVRKSNGDFATIAVLAHGRGGRRISTIDITRTVTGNSAQGYAPATGPDSLWELAPGLDDTSAGLAMNRPAVARVAVTDNGQTLEYYMVIAGTGVSYDGEDTDPQKGRIVAAHDAVTGELYWRFQTECPLTTAITVFETNDQGEPAPVPELDGSMDRAVFADRCGYVYKVDLAPELNGGWKRGIGAIQLGPDPSGQARFALFQTDLQRPVTGNIAARAVVDVDTTRVALFFGTGGLEDEPTFLQNTFYALAAAPDDPNDNDPQNLVFERILGECAPALQCEKFYGGVRVNPQQVIFVRVREPEIGVGGATCDSDIGRTVIESRSLVGDITTAIRQDAFTDIVRSGASSAPLTASGPGAYLQDGLGNAVLIGSPPTNNEGVSADEFNVAKLNDPMLILGWRQLY